MPWPPSCLPSVRAWGRLAPPCWALCHPRPPRPRFQPRSRVAARHSSQRERITVSSRAQRRPLPLLHLPVFFPSTHTDAHTDTHTDTETHTTHTHFPSPLPNTRTLSLPFPQYTHTVLFLYRSLMQWVGHFCFTSTKGLGSPGEGNRHCPSQRRPLAEARLGEMRQRKSNRMSPQGSWTAGAAWAHRRLAGA